MIMHVTPLITTIDSIKNVSCCIINAYCMQYYERFG